MKVFEVIGIVCSLLVVLMLIGTLIAWCADFIDKVRRYNTFTHLETCNDQLRAENVTLTEELRAKDAEIVAIKEGRPYR